jgi:hypothetical protein
LGTVHPGRSVYPGALHFSSERAPGLDPLASTGRVRPSLCAILTAVTDTPPKPPRGLGTRGRRFWTAVHAETEFTVDETGLLAEVSRTLDTCERLEVSDPDGNALRQSRTLLARLLAQLDLPDSGIASPTSARGRAANRARWSQPHSGAAVSEAATAAAMARWHGRGA